MERRHADRLRARFPDQLKNKPLIPLRIPDDYGFMDPELLSLLRSRLSAHIDAIT